MKAETPKQALIAARWILDNYGWCQGGFIQTPDKGQVMHLSEYARLGGDPKSVCFCADGALRTVECSDPKVYNEAKRLLLSRISSQVFGNLWSWNDYILRTKEEVIALFDAAIVIA